MRNRIIKQETCTASLQHLGPYAAPAGGGPVTAPAGSYNPPDFSRSEAWDVGFHRLVTVWQSPPFAAGFIAVALWFLVIFASNVLITSVNVLTLGIGIALGTLSFMALVTIILFVL